MNLKAMQTVFQSKYLENVRELCTPQTSLEEVLPPLGQQAVEALHLLYQQGPAAPTVPQRLADYLDSPVLDCIHKQGWTTKLSSHLAQRGHLTALQWARHQGCPWDEQTCANAAKDGHLEVLQWARQQGCPWNWRTCAYAARGGHLEVMRWARHHGCPG